MVHAGRPGQVRPLGHDRCGAGKVGQQCRRAGAAGYFFMCCGFRVCHPLSPGCCLPQPTTETGETPNIRDFDCSQLKELFPDLFSLVCGGETNWGPWQVVRGRCVKYRQLDESCNAYFVGGSGSLLGPQYAVEADSGRPPKRPLLCAPGLACTGDVGPVPHTCVKERPRDTCYQVRK